MTHDASHYGEEKKRKEKKRNLQIEHAGAYARPTSGECPVSTIALLKLPIIFLWKKPTVSKHHRINYSFDNKLNYQFDLNN